MSSSFEDRYDASIAERFLGEGGPGLPKYLGVRIVDVGPGTLRAQMQVFDELLTSFGNIHGGVLAAVCDHVLGCVCYPLMKRGQWAATTEFKINLLAPVSKGVIVADGSVVSMSRTQAVVRIDVTNEGRLVGVAQGTVTIRDPRPDG